MIDLLQTIRNEYCNSMKKKLRPVIVQVGTGGTGSLVVQQIAQLIQPYKQKGYYCIADPDHVEEKNLRNQLFTKYNLEQSKADVLANRYRAAYDLPILSSSEGYIENVEDLENLFKGEFGYFHYEDALLPVLIGCVDNHYSRQIMHEFFKKMPTVLYIDAGNESAEVPADYPSRPMKEWTDEEEKTYEESGWTGQVVCGLKVREKTFLDPVATRYPDVLEDKDTIAPSTLSCEELSASDPQRSITNRMAAMAIGSYMAEIVENGTVSKAQTVFHARRGYMQSERIT